MVVDISKPTEQMITLAEAKAHLRILDDAENDTITALISMVTAAIEDYTGRALLERQKALYVQNLTACIQLPEGPVKTVDDITYTDPNGTQATLDLASTSLRSKGRVIAELYIKDFPQTNGEPDSIEIKYTAGQAPADIPEPIKHAGKLLIGHFWENRETTTVVSLEEVPFGFKALLAKYKVVRV